MKKIFTLLLVVFLSSLAACSRTSPSNSNLLLVSTTSTQDSGLLDVLLPAFSKATGVHVQLVAVGSGQALKLGEQGNADVLLVHSPAAENDFMAKGFGIDRRLVMHNDFVIVGPKSDPASLHTQTTAVNSFKGIFTSASTFVSRGDNSGTNVKELSLWKSAGLDPLKQNWYLESGQGQGATLSIASEKQAYALTDRGTFLAYKANIDLIILFEHDPVLLNIYHVITVNPQKWPHVNVQAAKVFADYLTSQAGQDIIRNFGVEKYGQPSFYPDANKTDAELGVP
jgi:tungstate transport system substrate-binding protein